MRRSTLGLFGIALLLVVSSAQAQGPRGGGRGGFGGRGGGPGSMQASGVMLAAMPEVQKELATTDVQNKAIEALAEETQQQLRESFGNFRDQEDLSEAERKERLDEMQKKAAAASQQANDKLAKLLQPAQLERLGQLRLQREGAAAIAKPETAQVLGLSEEQQTKIRALQPEQGPGGRASREDREKAGADTLALLSDDQKAKWTAMQGKAFEFPEPRGGFGGFGRGEGGRGEGRRGGRGPGGGEGGRGRGGRGQNEERVRPPRKAD